MKERAYTTLHDMLKARKKLFEATSPLLSTRTPMCVVRMECKKVAAADSVSDAVGRR